MKEKFKPGGLPILIGSLPLSDHDAAVRLVFDHTPEIPLWIQLPVHLEEGMVNQFLPGMPGIHKEEGRVFVDLDSTKYADEQVQFYEEFMAVVEDGADIDASRFALKPEVAAGFFALTAYLDTLDTPPVALKAQVTGPITFTMGLTDRQRRAIFYDPQARDAAVKLLAQKARWQVRCLSRYNRPVILFLDEPSLAGFGSSEMISVSKEEISACLSEVVDAVHADGGIAGIHVCANTDWGMVLDTGIDVINFDAYAYFDRFILYPEKIKAFIDAGGILAFGIVPTLSPEDLDRETADSLLERWEGQADTIAGLGIDRDVLLAQSLISPSCGAGSLDYDRAVRALSLTKAVSAAIRNKG